MSTPTKQILDTTTVTAFEITGNVAAGYVTGNNGTTFDNTAGWPNVSAVLAIPKGLNSAAAANTAIEIYAVAQGIDGATNASPGGTVDGTPAAESGLKSSNGATYCGAFLLPATTTPGTMGPVVLPIPGIKSAKFFMRNMSGVQANADGTDKITLKITGHSYGQ